MGLNLEINGQEILTRDKAQLRINFTARYQVEDVAKALLRNKEFEKQLCVLRADRRPIEADFCKAIAPRRALKHRPGHI